MREPYEINWSRPVVESLSSLPCVMERRLRLRVKELADAASLAHHHVANRGPQRVRISANDFYLDCLLEPQQRTVTISNAGRAHPAAAAVA